MITRDKDLFILNTKDTTYSFRILPSGHLEHMYYGKKIHTEAGYEPLTEKVEFVPGASITYSTDFPTLCLEDRCLEMSSYGKGDIREAFMEITHADGSGTCDLLFREARILDKKKPLLTLPSAYYEEKNNTVEAANSGSSGRKQTSIDASGQASTNVDPSGQASTNADPSGQTAVSSATNQETGKKCLELELYDKNYNITLIMTYSVFYESNVITRSTRVINNSDQPIRLERIMSSQLDLDTSDYVISTFHGAWAREMNRYDTPAQPGILINDTKAGISGNRSNPFFMVGRKDTVEDYGDCYGFNLIYSGNHYSACEVNSYGKLRIIHGIQPAGFEYLLLPEESFETPEAVLTYSDRGFTGMSHNMHHFVKNHIVRGEWKNKVRPILINSWEANYFKFTEGKLLKLAKAAKEAGIELFVLDDGWFGRRNDDTSSLGDWKDNKDKLPGGLKGLAEKVKALGMEFGIWVEPEMVNEDSDLYRSHPEYAVKIPETKNSLGRNQMILDLTREDVRSYLIDEMTRVFSGADITYVKWDMNRIFSDQYSSQLRPEHQKEFNHRYIMGLYQILDTLTKRFPKILFESCASGGNRFDLGMLCYMPQTWASDNTDAICRTKIQTGYSYGYPMSVIGAHVSNCPNHQTLRTTSLDTRFEVAAFGLLGYELNITELSSEDKKHLEDQVSFYKKYRETLQFGDFYRVKDLGTGECQWLTVAKDKKTAIGLYLQKEATPNYSYGKFKTKGLAPEVKYHFTNRQQIFNIKEFGDLINMISPIHIKKDSIAHNLIAMVKKMPGEVEDAVAYGDVFNHAGVKLKPSFGGTGYNDNVRLFKDYASRLYIWEQIGDTEMR